LTETKELEMVKLEPIQTGAAPGGVGGPAGGGNAQSLANETAAANIAQARDKLAGGDVEGARKELEQAVNELKDAAKGADKAPPPGQQLSMEDLLKMLQQILEQGKKQSAESPANQSAEGGKGAQGAEGAQGGGQGGMMEKMLEVVMEMLKQMAGGSAQEGKAA
jgi:hypothetical protein